ncbi:MAG TPA: nucleotidyltransferase [Clostridiaceae bacterium]|nr:nucleotidyltransferase [Clostridiaceae bacterium]
MNITGIVVEYNPMHNGHLHHLELCRGATGPDGIVAVMSGNFVQRGTPALLDKWTRTKHALENGVDLVLELPVLYALSSAEFFASGAVGILEGLGNVRSLCFGSEYTEMDKMLEISDFLLREPQEYRDALKKHLGSGVDFPTARSLSLKDTLRDPAGYLEASNCILGIEYCKSLLRLKSSVMPVAVQRSGSIYRDSSLSPGFSSATSIREHLRNNREIDELKPQVPKNVFLTLKELKLQSHSFAESNAMLPYLKYRCLTGASALKTLPDVVEGLENRIFSSTVSAESFDQLIDSVKTKRYAYTRISRIMTQFFIGFDQFDTAAMRKEAPQYIRVLGFTKRGAEILREAKRSSTLPIISKVREKEFKALDLELQATRAYSLINPDIRHNEDFFRSPIIMV